MVEKLQLPSCPTKSRIPQALQKVFVDSNEGKRVDLIPPNNIASRIFPYNGPIIHRRRPKKQQHEGRKSNNSKPLRKNLKTSTMSPQTFLDMVLHRRGYPTRKYRTVDTGYFAHPTPLQEASYDVYLLRQIRARDANTLKRTLEVGLSPNPCNTFGESLMHMICRRGDLNLLQAQLEVGGSVQVSDDYGRTPLHDLCWRPQTPFDMVELIGKIDLGLFHLVDNHGGTPLSYVGKDNWCRWISFLESKVDEWWPKKGSKTSEESAFTLLKAPANSLPCPDPKNALPVELAKLVASGVIPPEEAILFSYESSESDSELSDDSGSMHSGDSDDSLTDDSMADLFELLELRNTHSLY